ncbi:MAG: pyridoxal-dependent decarboxylase [Lachnospiraceae bacterium]|nr:pyridoxal-dependent decarboxylase [Lachnospiraceae bacterium]MDE7285232.1 pyridoxal-dependent decarboxylase [Lachnospiraceae bacterium]
MKQLQTPFYRIKEKDLFYDVTLLKESLEKNWGNYIVGYSVKTNALPWLLTYMKNQGFYAEVVSKTEYDLASRLGFSGKQIIYNGPIKDKKVFETVLLAGGFINLDSNYELDWMEELSTLYPNRHFRIGLRINCDLAAICPDETLAEEEGGRFGYCYENGVFKSALDRLCALPNVWVSGLHLHSSTKSRTVHVFGALAKMAVKIAEEYDLSLDYVDMGGGYFGGRDDKPDYRDYFAEICKELSVRFDPQKTTLIAEPGVSLISRASTFETSVIDIKDIRGRKFVVTDGSRTNLNPLVTRHVYPHHIEYSSDAAARNREPSQWICGATCMEYDRLFEITDGTALIPGDKIIYDTAGGYTMCLNPLFINYFPAVYVEHEDGSIFTARDAWTNEEYLQKNHIE